MTEKYSKLFTCSVHNAIRVSHMALKIIDTLEFQRMRDIKQLGPCHYVYPSATHTRFEHSIGVYHLAGIMLEKIQQQYPDKEYHIQELNKTTVLDSKIIECVKIAALCHDIGHGPFSHVFDDVLLKNSSSPNRFHEVRSCKIVEMLCRRELKDELDDAHIEFIKSIINPTENHTGALYQIVSNNLNGIDVDKLDYLIRDARNIGITIGFNAHRLLSQFIIDDNNNIAYPKHCSIDVYELFHSRYIMHKKIYGHKTVKLIEMMLSDLFEKIDPIFKISESINEIEAFCKYTDHTIFYCLQTTFSPICKQLNSTEIVKIKEANDIYHNIIRRDLYQQILDVTSDKNAEMNLKNIIRYLINEMPGLSENDFGIIKVQFGFMSGKKPDPFNSIFFYDKRENGKSFQIDKTHISALMNNKTQETRWHLICKNRHRYREIVDKTREFIGE